MGNAIHRRLAVGRWWLVVAGLLPFAVVALSRLPAEEGAGDPTPRVEATALILDCDADTTTDENDGSGYPNYSLGDCGSVERTLKVTQPTFVSLNVGVDENLVPGFAKGVNMFGNDNTADPYTRFRHIVLTVPGDANITTARVKFTYTLSNPADMQRSANPDGSYSYTAGSGLFRVWGVEGSNKRNGLSRKTRRQRVSKSSSASSCKRRIQTSPMP